MLAKRNRLARGLFTEAIVSNQTAVAVVPRPEVRPYFVAVFSTEIAHLRKRRGSESQLRHVPPDALVIADVQECQRVGRSRRAAYQQPRARKLTSGQEEMIRRSADRSLRDLACELGVSRETIRAVRNARLDESHR